MTDSGVLATWSPSFVGYEKQLASRKRDASMARLTAILQLREYVDAALFSTRLRAFGGSPAKNRRASFQDVRMSVHAAGRRMGAALF